MYRRTRKYQESRAAQAKRQRAQRITKDQARLTLIAKKSPPDYPSQLPDLRFKITFERFDFGHEKHVLEGHKTRRVDLLRWVADGKPMASCGLSKALALARKSMPRVLSERAI